LFNVRTSSEFKILITLNEFFSNEGVKSFLILAFYSKGDFDREKFCEYSLRFAGFVIISCPLKSDSKAVIKELLNASHHVSTLTNMHNI
jgi:magnesium-transporting ATPase (P-type)